MEYLKLQTILFSYIFSNLVCAVVLSFLWRQNRSRYFGLDLWMLYFVCNFVGILLLALRGIISNFISMLIGNFILVFGVWILYIGLERFLENPGKQVHNYILLVSYIVLQAYFIYIYPSLLARNILISIVLLILFLQITWLLLKRVDSEMLTITRSVAYASIAASLICAIRIVVDLVFPPGNDVFQTTVYESLLYLGFQMLYIILTFSLFMMVNRKLFIDLELDDLERKKAEGALQLSEEKFSKAFQSSPDAILISRMADGKIIEANDSFYRITGFTREEALANTTLTLGIWVNPSEREKVITEIQKNSRIRDYEFDVQIKSGMVLKAQFSGELIKIGDEDLILSVIRDISENKRIEAIIQLRLELWEFSIDHSAIDVMQKALDEVEKLTGSKIGFYHFVEEDQNTLTLQAWSTRTKKEFCRAESGGLHYPISKAGVWADCVQLKKTVIHNDYASLPHKKGIPGGHPEIIRELIVPVIREGRVVCILGVGNKINDYDEKDVELVDYMASLVWSIVTQKQADEKIRALNSQLERLAMTDDLTGLPNRRSFFMKGNDEINKNRRYHFPLSLIMLDIDKFKRINDTYGHEYGDLALQCIAKTLREHIREVDLPARLGGEEFGILLPNTSLSEAAVLAERIRKAIEEKSCLFQEKTVSMTASLGVAMYTEDMKNLDGLFHAADTAMYQAKNQGRNQVILF